MESVAQRARSFDEPLVGGGWVAFAGTMLILLGCFQAIAGFVALFDNNYYVVRSANLVPRAASASASRPRAA